jgi:hypothetical protein
MKRAFIALYALLWVWLAAGCSRLQPSSTPTPLSMDALSTAVASTLQAGSQVATLAQPANQASGAALTPTPQADPYSIMASPTPLALRTDLEPAVSPSVTASPLPSATFTLSPTSSPSRGATRTPSITPTPPIPSAGVQFAEPGPMSKVVSPLHLITNLHSAPSGTYRVELWIEPLRPEEEPRLLYREVQRLISNPADWIYLDQDIEFQLSRVSELGQLRVSVYDEYDRPVSVNSVDLILLSMGPSLITPSNIRSEPIVIRQPAKNQLIQGGTLTVSGLAKPSHDFLLVELVAADGTVAGYRQAFVSPAADGSYVPFSVDVPYQVASGTWVRVEVSESGTRISGVQHLSSVEVYLSP